MQKTKFLLVEAFFFLILVVKNRVWGKKWRLWLLLWPKLTHFFAFFFNFLPFFLHNKKWLLVTTPRNLHHYSQKPSSLLYRYSFNFVEISQNYESFQKFVSQKQCKTTTKNLPYFSYQKINVWRGAPNQGRSFSSNFSLLCLPKKSKYLIRFHMGKMKMFLFLWIYVQKIAMVLLGQNE